MKFRTGYVSNSSSSSFVLSKDKLPTIWDVAMLMIPVRNWDGVEDDLKFLHEQKEFKTEVRGIAFNSCNYATYIWDGGDQWWIGTCNNHPFYTVLDEHRTEPNEELLDIVSDCMGGRAYGSDIYHFLEYYLGDRYVFQNAMNPFREFVE